MDIQQYQQFWHNKLSHLDSQLLLDYDTFITAFSKQIHDHTSISLTQLQKQIIKSEIDPQQQNQVYKNGFLLFIKNFWSLPNNRTKLFNNKINLDNIKSHHDKIPMAGFIKINIKYPYQQIQQNNKDISINSNNNKIKKISIEDNYLIQHDKLTLISSTHPNSSHSLNINKPTYLPNPGFISLGSSPTCQIQIPCNEINPQHLKLIYLTKPIQQGIQTYSFKPQPIPTTFTYIRDISTSSRVRYLIDSQYKYIVLKSGMVIGGIGLISELFEIVIDYAPNCEGNQINVIMQNFNADRKVVKFGQPWKPQKTIINYDLQQISQAMVTDLYNHNLYYPQLKPTPPTQQPEQSQKQPQPCLSFTIINRRTLQQTKHEAKTSKMLVVGRDKQKCHIVIESISIRPIQFVFEMINDVWFLHQTKQIIQSNGNKSIGSTVGIYLSKDMNRNSNRLLLGTVYPEYFAIKNNVEIKIQIKNREKKE